MQAVDEILGCIHRMHRNSPEEPQFTGGTAIHRIHRNSPEEPQFTGCTLNVARIAAYLAPSIAATWHHSLVVADQPLI